MGQSPTLVNYCRQGNIEEARKLIEGGANVNEKDGEYQYSPLHLAVREGHLDLTRLLIQSGANLQAKLSYGYSPLHTAAKANQYDCAMALLEAGAQVDAFDDMHDTPMHVAAREGCIDIALLLIDYGADIELKERYGRKPIECFPLPAQQKYVNEYIANTENEEPVELADQREPIELSSHETRDDFVNLPE